MTSAPAGLLTARRLLLDHLDMHPGQTVAADLDPAEVGIVGNTRHVTQGDSYHLGLPEQSRSGYSVVESARDRAGLSEYASAIDVGSFRVTTPRGTFDLRDFSLWLVAECRAGAPDTLDIREVIYSPDGVIVKRWDRLGKRTSGDSSHRTHTHISEFRDARGRNMPALFRRWLTHIGLIEEDDMATVAQVDWDALIWRVDAVTNMRDTIAGGPEKGKPVPIVQIIKALAARPPAEVDVQALATTLAPLLPGFTAEQLAGVIAGIRLVPSTPQG